MLSKLPTDDFFEKKCIIKNKNQEIREEMLNQIFNDIIKSFLDSIIFQLFLKIKVLQLWKMILHIK